jgi:chromosomal replication initiator protein
MLACSATETWCQFLEFIKQRCSSAEYENWFSPIILLSSTEEGVTLEVPNIFVREYLLDNYKQEFCDFFPLRAPGEPSIDFVIAKKQLQEKVAPAPTQSTQETEASLQKLRLNKLYTFQNFIEGPSNQFVKSAAQGVAMHPGKSYNPLFIHGGVGLGKTHLLHGIGLHILTTNKRLRLACITTEGFINDLVEHLRNKTLDKMKRFYRNLDILLVDDIQFLQNRMNFEEEFCNTFESLINQNKQIVITSDKPPSQLKLSERLIARMEWGLVANIGAPDLETRVAILQHKAEQKGLKIPSRVAFFIAEHIYHNVRQLEGAINRLSAYCRMMQQEITEDIAERTLGEMFETSPKKSVTIEGILNSVSSMFNVKVSELRGSSREKKIAFPRQVAMYLAKEMMSDSLIKVAASFGGKKHSTVIHAWKKVSKQVEADETLRRQILMTKRNIET